jgi:hypothetical protein
VGRLGVLAQRVPDDRGAALIREHRFNSRWWGGRVGIVEDVADLSELHQFDWVELRAELATAPLEKIARAGFFQVDTQLPFRIALQRVPETPSLAALQIERGPFTIETQDVAPFAHERYRYLPGMTEERLTRRYADWAVEQVDQHPEWCLRVSSGGTTQGWFLSQMTEEGLNLELAMLHRSATISGALLYQKALVEYAKLGARLGYARFSVTNTAVLNIYAQLGARFLPPVGTWLWVTSPRGTPPPC